MASTDSEEGLVEGIEAPREGKEAVTEDNQDDQVGVEDEDEQEFYSC